jgi:hypothetical protein
MLFCSKVYMRAPILLSLRFTTAYVLFTDSFGFLQGLVLSLFGSGSSPECPCPRSVVAAHVSSQLRTASRCPSTLLPWSR